MKKAKHIKNILNSFERLTGKIIIPRKSLEADLLQIEEGEFALVSHNGAKDPILNYGNQFALKLWEMIWDDFIKTPSKKTAEFNERTDRDKLLKIVSKQGYIDQYEGVRISSKGKRFLIKNATIWNVSDENGCLIGQAAYFHSFEYIEEIPPVK